MIERMRKGKAVILIGLTMALAVVASMLAACSCSQQQPSSSSSSSESIEVNDNKMTSSASSKEPFYALIVGNDSRTGTVEIKKKMYADGKGRSDTMMLARVDPTTYKVTLITIPRDTMAAWKSGQKCKLNQTYEEGGIDELMDNVESLTGVRPQYYFDTTFVGFQDIVNSLGGITMNVVANMDMEDIVSGKDISFPAGEQHLDGAQALVYARERHAYESSGNQEAIRQSNDRHILQTMIQTLLSDKTKASSLVKTLYPFVKTNMSEDKFAAFVGDFADHAGQVTFIDGTGPYEGGIDAETQAWFATRDEAKWREIIAVVDGGGDPNSIISAPSL